MFIYNHRYLKRKCSSFKFFLIFILYNRTINSISILVSILLCITFTLTLLRVGKGIFVSREWSIFVRVKCEMLDFSVVKCDLFYSHEA